MVARLLPGGSMAHKWNVHISGTQQDILDALSSDLFAKIVQRAWPGACLRKKLCCDCGEPARQRCHAAAHPRPAVLAGALTRLGCLPGKQPGTVLLRDLVREFLQGHTGAASLSFKCEACHAAEPSSRGRKAAPGLREAPRQPPKRRRQH